MHQLSLPRIASWVVIVLATANYSTADEVAPPKIRAARSVHLGYADQEGTAFYNEVRVERSVAGSYFMVAGFNHGYFGIQEQNNGRKVVIFSVWDPTKGDAAADVPVEQRVEVLHQGADVEVKRFGGEGTGGQSFFSYDWKLGQTYRFLVKAAVSESKTAYAGYFYLPESSTWKHLVTFRTRTGGEKLKGLYSFVEDFRRDGKSANEIRRAEFGNGRVQDSAGRWTEILRARFTASGAAWEAKETIDAGIMGDRFFLQTGGATAMNTPLNSFLVLAPGNAGPPQVP